MPSFQLSQISAANGGMTPRSLPECSAVKIFTFGAVSHSSRTLDRNEVHVWRIQLNNRQEKVLELLPVLSADERARASRYRLDKHRTDFVQSRAALRSILGPYVGVRAADVEFRYGQHGKPQLALAIGESKVKFNFSRREALALVAITYDREVGVDLEFVRDDFPIFEVAEVIFSQAELEALHRLPEEQRFEGFYNCWTRKEAYVKALGQGLSFPLKQFDVSLNPTEAARLLRVDPDQAGGWMLHDLQIDENYIAALVVSR